MKQSRTFKTLEDLRKFMHSLSNNQVRASKLGWTKAGNYRIVYTLDSEEH